MGIKRTTKSKCCSSKTPLSQDRGRLTVMQLACGVKMLVGQRKFVLSLCMLLYARGRENYARPTFRLLLTGLTSSSLDTESARGLRVPGLPTGDRFPAAVTEK